MGDKELMYFVARCCRRWPIALGYPVRRCKLCNEAPVYTSENPDLIDWIKEGSDGLE